MHNYASSYFFRIIFNKNSNKNNKLVRRLLTNFNIQTRDYTEKLLHF